MKRLHQFITLLLLIFLFAYSFSQQIFAACGGTTAECTNVQCEKLKTGCSEYEDIPATLYAPAQHNCVSYFTYWATDTCCTYLYSGGGGCSCCIDGDDSCYTDCLGPTPGGGGGGSYSYSQSSYTPGNTPTPTPIQTGIVRARAVLVPIGTTSCTDVQASTNYIPVDMTLFSEVETKTTSTDGTYAGAARWPTSPVGTKSFSDAPSNPDYVLTLACWTRTSPAAQGSGYSATLVDGSTLTWQLGYTAGTGWFQAQGGDVYAGTQLRSYIPSAAVGGRYAVKSGVTGGTPGTLTYGSSYDFDSAPANGEDYVSSTNWLVEETQDQTDYYAVMYHRFGSPAVADYTGDTTLPTKLSSQTTPYYVNGNLTIDTADWVVGDGETITVLVNGNLTINRKITITGTGFVAFVVNGDITIGSSVGTTATSATPVIEGVYITSPAGTFRTSPSTTAAARRFVGEGTFLAGDFTLERDLDADAQNTAYAAELFIYNPELMIRMPEKMKDLPISWQEVAP